MVGLADLKRLTDNLKTCQMTVNKKYCYFQLSGLNTYEFLDILNYKSWLYKTYQKNVTVRYVNIIKKLERGNAILRTSVGFGPLLLRLLRGMKFQIRDQDIEAFRARNVVFPDLKVNLYDFQERIIQNWLNAGSVGVLKSPTGSGKCAKYNTLILTNKGLIKIEDIVKRISDSGKDDKDISQSSLYDSLGDEFAEEENIKGVNSVISISPDLNYNNFNISSRYDMGINDTLILTTATGYRIIATPEHKIIIINKDGNLEFKKLEDIKVEDYVAITYNTNIFNDKLKLNYWFRPSKYESNARFMKNIEYMNEEIARLLGYIISEGTDFGNRDSNITNYDEEVQDDIIKICDNIGLSPKYVYREEKNQENSVGIDIYSKSLLEFLYYLGYRHGSKNKEIPWSILQADKKCQIAFIRALFDGDGTVYHKDVEEREDSKKYAEYASYASSSYELCLQLQTMLLNMGIISSLKTKKGVLLEYRGELRQYEESYLLYITGGDLIKFAEVISFGLTRKKEILDKCIETLKNRERWTDIIYPNVYKKLDILNERLKILGQKGGIVKAWEEDFDFNGKIIKLTRRRKMSHFQYLEDCNFRREMLSYVKGDVYPSKLTLDKILNILNPNNYIDKLSESKEYQIYRYLRQLSDKFIFDKVEDIKKGKDRVYDVTIIGAHSYIGNGMINHNTVVGCAAIKETGRKALILVHTSDLLINVWNDSLVKCFGSGIMSQVGIVGGGLSDADRMAMKVGARTNDFDENMRKDIVIATFQTLNNKLDELSRYKFGLMIVDETHHVPSQMFRKVNAMVRAPYKMGLSATIRRLDGLERDIFGQLGDIQSSVSIRELINKGILAEPRFQSPIIVDKDIIDQIDNCGFGGLNLSRFVKKKSASSEKKKNYIVNICKNVAARGRKFLLFTDYVNAEDVYVRDMYAEALLAEGIRTSIIDQGMSAEERGIVFNFLEKGDISGIVFGKLGAEGINIPSVDVVIMANGIKSPITYCQRVGRAMRRIPGKDWCDVFEILIDTKMELKWSDYNFAEYREEGFQKLVYKVE